MVALRSVDLTPTAEPSKRRFLLLAAFVAVLAGLATVLVAMLAGAVLTTGSVDARFDSRRVHGPAGAVAPVTLAVSPVAGTRPRPGALATFASYLRARLGREVVLLERRPYQEAKELVERGDVDAAFLGAVPYVQLRRRGLATLLAVPKVRGSTLTRSVVVVGEGSRARSIDDLAGRRFAFTDPLACAGCLYPRWLLARKHLRPAGLFASQVLTYGDERSLRSVAAGVLDGAALPHLVLEAAREREPAVAARVRVVDESPPFGIDPLVVPTKRPPELARALRAALLEASRDPAGKALLQELDVDGFEPGDPRAYALVEDMLEGEGG